MQLNKLLPYVVLLLLLSFVTWAIPYQFSLLWDEQDSSNLRDTYDLTYDSEREILYVTAWYVDTVSIFNTTNKDNIGLIARISTGTQPYSVDGATGVDIMNDLLFVCALNDDTISVYNVSDPANPVGVTNYTDNSGAGSVDGCEEVHVYNINSNIIVFTESSIDDRVTILNFTGDYLAQLGDYSSSVNPCSSDGVKSVLYEPHC